MKKNKLREIRAKRYAEMIRATQKVVRPKKTEAQKEPVVPLEVEDITSSTPVNDDIIENNGVEIVIKKRKKVTK